MEVEKKQHGGVRKGAGRKKIENGRNISVALKLSTKAFTVLENMALQQNTTKNDIINKLLENMS